MKKLRIIFIPLILTVIFSACEDVIELDLNDSESKLVIEAVIVDSVGGNYVKISKSANFYDSNNFPKVSGADVKISDEVGTIFQMTEVAPGFYYHPTLSANYGETYKLRVAAEGMIINGTAVMPSKVQYDSLVVEENVSSFGDDGEYRVRVYFTDKVNEANYYYMKIFWNGEKEEQEALLDDVIFDGKSTSFPIFFYGYDLGDEVRVELFNLSEKMFRYYTTLAENADGGFFSAAPGNPPPSFDKDVLGYFGAFSVDSKTVIIQ
ncbi:MAG: DUF4249 domain-containing protein [Bacteroidia bacterium]|nr:DUF4249 domain-containing protein [Bacteroidia bacterium]